MRNSDMQQQWYELAANYPANNTLIQSTFGTIHQHYTSTHRHYHNLHHIAHLLQLCQKHNHLISDAPTVLFAAWFHDIIYQPQRTDNEEQSALLAQQLMHALQVPTAVVANTATIIRATQKHQLTDDDPPDTAVFLDFDLEVLAWPHHAYMAYTQQVRNEYSSYADDVFYPARLAFLRTTLQRTQIFLTPQLHELWHKAAIGNMQAEVEVIEQRINEKKGQFTKSLE